MKKKLIFISAPATYDEIEAKQTDLTDYFNGKNIRINIFVFLTTIKS
jgi:hypothetical protein